MTGTVVNLFGDLWQFQITTPSQITITLSRTDKGQLDTYLTLYDADLQIGAENNDIESSRNSKLNDIHLAELRDGDRLVLQSG